MYRIIFKYNLRQLCPSYLKVSGCRLYETESVHGHKRRVKSGRFELNPQVLRNRINQSNFYRLVTAYREHGHKIADINPVKFNPTESTPPELDLGRYGLNQSDLVNYDGIIQIPGTNEGSVEQALEHLRMVYTGNMAAEFTYLEEEEEREWFSQRMESSIEDSLTEEERIRLALELIKSQAFDHFLASKFPGLKRYGGEGAESMMGFFTELFRLSTKENLSDITLGMPHRGRLNLLTGLLNMSPEKLFRKLKGLPDWPDSRFKATGDVISHLISSTDIEVDKKSIHVTMLYNPSHLEAVNPVSMGKTRAKQLELKEGDYWGDTGSERNWSDRVLNVQVHGDAAYMGQGINQECLVLSKAPHFEIGGSIHLVVNNQVGFTTPAERGRSSRYCTDLAKIISAPVIHVNGDHPELVVKATRIAFEYQRNFRKDVFIDLNCYRQWGHNELDDPTITNPALYGRVHSRKTVPDMYAGRLVEEGVLTKEEVDGTIKIHTEWMSQCMNQSDAWEVEAPCFKRQWTGWEQSPSAVTRWDTGVDPGNLSYIAQKSVEYPTDFCVHPNLVKSHVVPRLDRVGKGNRIDWATAEAMAIGSLLYDGYNVRISGQDVGRGTFSHRHAMLVDQKTNRIHIPLNHMDENQKGRLEIANSILSEEAVLGFEYGMSIESPKNLIIWEAQFGDFFNGAQIIFDTFISSGETKWLWSSGITIMLPHGYDGAGPEHSSCRLERFLQLTDSKEHLPDGDDVNMQIAHPSTPAQYFHLLRRQMIRNYRKPLIIVAPKTLLRLSAAVSNLNDMAPGRGFKNVITDFTVQSASVKKVIFCSGRHYYNLVDKKKSLGVDDVALIRLESLCPFPTHDLMEEVSRYPNAKVFVWSQEEPRNMGAWSYLKPRFENLIGKRLKYAGRETLAAPAVGVGQWHQQQSNDVINQPFQSTL